jgi:hypothetical protein
VSVGVGVGTCLTSLNEWHGISNYHLMSDTPDNLNYGTIAHATRIAYGVAHHLSQHGQQRRSG